MKRIFKDKAKKFWGTNYKKKNIFLICSIVNFADNVKDMTKYLETTMKNKGELKYKKSDNSISTYTKDGKLIYKSISLFGSDTLEYSDYIQVKISKKNRKLKPFIEANISNGEEKFYESLKIKGIAHYKNYILDGKVLEYNEKGKAMTLEQVIKTMQKKKAKSEGIELQ